MTSPSPVLRPFTPADLSAAHALTSAFGWPHRREDWALMWYLGEGLVVEADGGLAGTGLRWRYGATGASVGLIGIAPAMQGLGLGRKLMQGVLAGLEGCTIVLHATQAGLALYRRLGFVADGTIRQHQGVVAATSIPSQAADEHLPPVAPRHLQALTELDRIATGFDRGALLTGLVGAGRGVMLTRGGVAVGYALSRPFGRGTVIGPVVAPDLAGAQQLILHELAANGSGFVRIDVPGDAGMAAWLATLELADAGAGVRMVRGRIPSGGASHTTYALASQAWG